MSPLFAVILFRFFSFTFLIHQYMLSFLNFVFLLPPFYFATVFRSFISPLYFAFLFRQSFFPFYFILPSIFALLIYFAILFALCCISPSFFRPSNLFRHSFLPFYYILPFFLLFYFISPFFLPFYFVFSFIFSNANSFPHFLYQVYIQIYPRTRGWIHHNNTTYFSRLMRIWIPATHHTFHESYDSQRLTKLGIQYCMRLIQLTKPEIQYDSRLTTLVLISPVNFALLFFRLSISFHISIVKYILVSTFLYHLYPNSFSYTNRSAFHFFNLRHISMLSLYFAFLISPCHFHFLFDLFISSFNFHPF